MPPDRQSDACLAELAQGLWCRKMAAEGWKPGPWDPQGRTHDALVPFAQLSPPDRRRLVRAVSYLHLEPVLLSAVDHQRGPDRELTLEEMKEGLPVTLAGGGGDPEPGRGLGPEIGRIESWVARGDELELVRVRWEDGTLAEYSPAERELKRAGW